MQQFKIGDYVILQNENIYRILNVSTTGNNIFLDTNEYPASDNWWSTSSCKLWQPKEGEWCWSKKRNELTNNVCELIRFYWDNSNISDCEPFIGELPTFLKDKR